MYIPKLDNKSTLAISQNRKDLFKTAPEMRAVPRARMKAKAGSFFTAGEQLTPDERLLRPQAGSARWSLPLLSLLL